MSLTVRDGTDVGLTGVGIYFIRTSTKRTLGCAKTAHRTMKLDMRYDLMHLSF